MIRAVLYRAAGCLVSAAVGIAPGVGVGASYYWDTNGATAGIGSAGGAAADWLSNSWATGTSGTLLTAPWPNTQPSNADEAVFMGTAGTVNVDADVYANAITFQTNNYSIASTGGALHLAGADPTITVNLPSSNNTATISAPILGDNGLTLAGNSLAGGNKFLVLANTSESAPNAFSGTLTIEAGGALRLGGGVTREQIPDGVDMDVAGVIDFITSGGASDGKQERVRNVSVSGPSANFSIGNEADFLVNSISASSTGSGSGVAVNGNYGLMDPPHAPGRLIINGWADGTGHLTLDGARVQLNNTGASSAIGGRILLSGNIYSSGSSQIYNNNGGTTPEDNHFDNKALDFTGAAHTIDVADGTLTFTSRTASQYVDVTATNPGGTILTKTGPGVWLYEYAVQTSFMGTNRVAEGTLRLGAAERLANAAQLEVAGGTFDMQGFAERVAGVVLDGGTITGTAAARLIGTSFDVRSGTVNVRLDGLAGLTKTTAGTVTLDGNNTYTGDTTVLEGTLSITNPGLNSLADAASVRLVTGATLDLNFAGSDTISALVIDGASRPIGTWGRLGHPSADFTSALITGDGLLNVTALLSVPGDYNGDGVVNAADYIIWRDNLGGDGSLLGPSRDPLNEGAISIADYNSWKANYGDTLDAGGGSLSAAVPEPATWLLVLMAVVAAGRFQRSGSKDRGGKDR